MTKRTKIRLAVIGGLALVVLGCSQAVEHFRLRRAAERADLRSRQLRACHPHDCGTPVNCAAGCAHAFLARNGYLDPALAQPDQIVSEFADGVRGESLQEILAHRAWQLQDWPSAVCEYGRGSFLIIVPYKETQDPLWGRLVSMTKDFDDLHVSHEQMIFRRPPDECSWTPWVDQQKLPTRYKGPFFDQ